MAFLSRFFDLFRRKNVTSYNREVASPNGRLKLTFILKNGEMFYRLRRDDREIIRDSKLGFNITGMEPLGAHLALIRAHDKDHEGKWKTIWGEESEIECKFSEAAFYLSETTGQRRIVTMRFRVYNDGMGFRYEVPVQNNIERIVIADELTEFNLDMNSTAWWIQSYQPDRYEYLYQKTPISSIPGPVQTPLTVRVTSGYYISIHEAALYNYGSMNIKRSGKGLAAEITPLSDGMRAYVDLPFVTPWRTVVVAQNAVELISSRMMLNMNESSAISDTSWIEPTKFMGIWWALFLGEYTWGSGERHGATTEHAMEYIDYCKKYNIPALLIEGWNETWNGNWLENGAIFNFTKPYPDFDIKKVAEYARQNGVELVGHHETSGDVANYERQMERAFSFYEALGIKYVKLGYVGSLMNHAEYHHSQFGVRHYQKMLETAAKYHVMVDVHEPIKGTGLERTWPNMMTREGARGQEYEGGGITPEHAVTIPFTRCLAGGFDYTPGIFDLSNYARRVTSTLARQLAFYVTIYSSMQMVADRPEQYKDQPAFKFIQDVPVDWGESRPLLGEIGEFYVCARRDRKSEDWYIGGISNEQPRTVAVYLEFLDEGHEYVAEIYKDSDDAHYRDHQMGITLANMRVKKGDTLNIYIAPGGGFGVRVRMV